jgi:hypothetical protein
MDDIFSTPASPASAAKSDLSLLFAMPVQKAAPAAPQPAEKPPEKPAEKVVSLDDAILNFFGANDKK